MSISYGGLKRKFGKQWNFAEYRAIPSKNPSHNQQSKVNGMNKQPEIIR